MSDDILKQLAAILEARKEANPDSSYVAGLYRLGTAKIAQKVGEEAVETVIEAMRVEAGQTGARELLAEESADLVFHLLVLWSHLGMTPDDILAILQKRLGTSGLTGSQ